MRLIKLGKTCIKSNSAHIGPGRLETDYFITYTWMSSGEVFNGKLPKGQFDNGKRRKFNLRKLALELIKINEYRETYSQYHEAETQAETMKKSWEGFGEFWGEVE